MEQTAWSRQLVTDSLEQTAWSRQLGGSRQLRHQTAGATDSREQQTAGAADSWKQLEAADSWGSKQLEAADSGGKLTAEGNSQLGGSRQRGGGRQTAGGELGTHRRRINAEEKAKRGKEWNKFCPQAAATTLAFSSVFILFL